MYNKIQYILICLFVIIILTALGIWRYNDGKIYRKNETLSLAKSIKNLSLDFTNYLVTNNINKKNSTEMWESFVEQKNNGDSNNVYGTKFKSIIKKNNITYFVFVPTWVEDSSIILVFLSNETEEYRIVGISKRLHVILTLESTEPNVIYILSAEIDKDKNNMEIALDVITHNVPKKMFMSFVP